MSLPINIKIANTNPSEERSDAVVVFVPEKNATSYQVFRDLDRSMKNALSTVMKDEQFSGRIGESICYHTGGSIRAGKVIMTGLGKLEELTDEMFRRAAAVAAIAGRNSGCATLSFTFPADAGVGKELLARAIVEGAVLGTYRYLRFKTKEEEMESGKKIKEIRLLTEKNSAMKDAVSKAEILSEATLLARDLVNEPANNLNPQTLADAAKKMAAENGLEYRVIEATELKKMGAGAILGVGSGSSVPPRMITLTYNPPGKKRGKKIALVGKGITFDSGGLSLKQAKYMETMKCDMAGAAAVLCTMSALKKMNCQRSVIGILCAAENMPSGSAIRPGDVLHAMNGKSIEVINTDAEGRLVLADGLSWAVKQGAEEVLDLATLTGACVIGLGPYIAGIMGNDRDLISGVIEAGRAAGESYWELPIPNEYDFMVKSDIADIKNLAPNSEAGAIQGALFLREFVGETKWAHLDIAGPAWGDRDFFHTPKNGTGFGVRTLLEYLSR